HIGQIALAAALGYRYEVVGIPERFAAAFPQIPLAQKHAPRGVIQLPHVAPHNHGVGAALCADAAVALEDLFTEVGRIGAQAPLVNAGVGAEAASSLRRFGRAPPAQRAARRTAFDFVVRNAATGLSASEFGLAGHVLTHPR